MLARSLERRRPRSAWTAFLAVSGFFALAASIGLVSPRSRTAAEPPSAPTETAEQEPPPSPLTAPRLHEPDASASSSTPARESAWRAEDAGSGPAITRPASTKHAPELAELEIRTTAAGRAAPDAWIELVHTPAEGAASVALHRADGTGRLRLALAPGAVRAAAWSGDAAALPASAELVAGVAATLVLALEPAYPVAGRVVDARTGAPLAGAEVAIWTFAERDVVTTGADGTFRHPRFPARAPAQQIAARAAGHGQAVRYLRIAADGSWKLLADRAGAESVRGTGTPWLELELAPELRVRGRVVAADGRPIPGARAAAEGFFHAMPSVASRDHVAADCNDAGTFELTGLRSDIGHALLVEAPGCAASVRELPADATELDLGDLVLVRETVLAGVVIDGDGLPLAGVEVVLHFADDGAQGEPLELPAGTLDTGARLAGREQRARTDAHGTFVFEHLVPRPVLLSVAHAGAVREEAVAPRADGSFPAPCITLAPASFAVAQRLSPQR